MFSREDYAFAARMLGLPTPITPDEQAAAAPVVAEVLRNYAKGYAPNLEGEPGGMYTGATRSINSYPDVDDPMGRNQLAARLRVEQVQPPSMDEVLVELIERICQRPDLMNEMLMFLDMFDRQDDMHMNELSSQRPAEYDTPNMGANYSMLNSPSSNNVPPSIQFQQLS